MVAIENQINRLIEIENETRSFDKYLPIENWKYVEGGAYLDDEWMFGIILNKMIIDMPLVEAQTSPSQYIREVRAKYESMRLKYKEVVFE